MFEVKKNGLHSTRIFVLHTYVHIFIILELFMFLYFSTFLVQNEFEDFRVEISYLNL